MHRVGGRGFPLRICLFSGVDPVELWSGETGQNRKEFKPAVAVPTLRPSAPPGPGSRRSLSSQRLRVGVISGPLKAGLDCERRQKTCLEEDTRVTFDLCPLTVQRCLTRGGAAIAA